MTGLPRKSTIKQFKKLMKKSGKAKTNVSSGATDPSTRKIATYEQFISMMEGIKWYKNGKLGSMEEFEGDDINDFDRDFEWQTASDKKIKLKFLETSHLKNIINYLNFQIDGHESFYKKNQNPIHLVKIDENKEKLNMMLKELKYRSESDYFTIVNLMPKELYDFLNKKRILSKYVYYFQNSKSFETSEHNFEKVWDTYNDFFGKFDKSYLIGSAFSWDDTEDGFEYWEETDMNYQESL